MDPWGPEVCADCDRRIRDGEAKLVLHLVCPSPQEVDGQLELW